MVERLEDVRLLMQHGANPLLYCYRTTLVHEYKTILELAIEQRNKYTTPNHYYKCCCHCLLLTQTNGDDHVEQERRRDLENRH